MSTPYTTLCISSFPSKYNDFSNVFEKKNVDHLPEHRSYDCPVGLKDGTLTYVLTIAGSMSHCLKLLSTTSNPRTPRTTSS